MPRTSSGGHTGGCLAPGGGGPAAMMEAGGLGAQEA